VQQYSRKNGGAHRRSANKRLHMTVTALRSFWHNCPPSTFGDAPGCVLPVRARLRPVKRGVSPLPCTIDFFAVAPAIPGQFCRKSLLPGTFMIAPLRKAFSRPQFARFARLDRFPSFLRHGKIAENGCTERSYGVATAEGIYDNDECLPFEIGMCRMLAPNHNISISLEWLA